MAMPFYVPPEQLMKDRSDYARKGIARGKPVVALEYADGILFIADNTSTHLHKLSEIYDRIAFAGVGKFSEFENLRIAGVRLADIRGYSYGREDVTAKSLANAYSQALSNVFTQEMKPYEIEVLVAQVGESHADNELFHIVYDGSVADEHQYVGMGGRADELTSHLKDAFQEAMSLEQGLQTAARALYTVEGSTIDPENLEAAYLDRNRDRRKFRRIADPALASILGDGSG